MITLAGIIWPLNKVIRSDTDQSATYEFLLVIQRNYGPILYNFCKFFPPRTSNTHA